MVNRQVWARRKGRLAGMAFNLSSKPALHRCSWACLLLLPSGEGVHHAGLARFEPERWGATRVRRFEPTLTYSAHWIAHRGLDRAPILSGDTGEA